MFRIFLCAGFLFIITSVSLAGDSLSKSFISDNRWGLGFAWMPYSQMQTISYDVYSNAIHINSNTEIRSWIDAEFSYGFSKLFRATCSIDYSLNNKDNESWTYIHNYDPYSVDYKEVESAKRNITIVDFTLSAKYYLIPPQVNKAIPFIIAGFGKKFAFTRIDFDNSSNNNNFNTSASNLEDYIEHVYSPLHFHIGCGAEYWFNESLTFMVRLRFNSEYRSAELKSWSSDGGEQKQTYYEKITEWTVAKDVAFGLNLYF